MRHKKTEYKKHPWCLGLKSILKVFIMTTLFSILYTHYQAISWTLSVTFRLNTAYLILEVLRGSPFTTNHWLSKMYLPSIVTFRKPVLKLSVSIRSGHIFDAVALPPKNTSKAFLSWYSLSPHGQCKHQWAHLDVTMGVYISCEYGCHYGMLSLSWRRLKKKGRCC